MKYTLLISGLAVMPVLGALEFKDTEGKHLDVVSDGKVLVRYMYEHDTSDKDKHHDTYKPYLHVFDKEGQKPITKGPGGQFTHHRGIFIGWSKVGFNGKKYDRWHMKGGDIVHQKFTKQETKGDSATFTSVTHWMDEAGKAFIEEERTFTVTEGGHGGRVFVDFNSKITPMRGDIELKGDPEHAGIHYRPADNVDKKATKYVFPEGIKQAKGAKDMPWAAQNHTIEGKQYGVVHLNAKSNPKDTVHSAYRDYGRFGAFFQKDVKQGESLSVDYGFLILDGELPSQEDIQKVWEAWGK